MRRLNIILLLLTVLLFSCGTFAQDYKTIRLASEEWENATNADGTGLYWDIFRLVYEDEGIEVEYTIVPYARAVMMVYNNQADAWVGSYMNEEDFPVYPEFAFDADIVAGIYNGEEYPGLEDQSDLAGLTIGWVRGYAYDLYLDVDVEKVTVNKRVLGLKMLGAGRLDMFIDADIELEKAIPESGLDMDVYTMKEFIELGLYPAFARSGKGKALSMIWDRRIRELKESGELDKLYKKHDYTDFRPGH